MVINTIVGENGGKKGYTLNSSLVATKKYDLRF